METWWDIFKRQTLIMLRALEETLDFLPEVFYEKTICGFPVWQNAYHTIYSLDLFFFGPHSFQEPAINAPDLNDLGRTPSKILTKKEIMDYFRHLKLRMEVYLEKSSPQTFSQKIQNSRWTFLDLMIAQHRHVHFHLGWLQACLKADGRPLPPWVGIDKDWLITK